MDIKEIIKAIEEECCENTCVECRFAQEGYCGDLVCCKGLITEVLESFIAKEKLTITVNKIYKHQSKFDFEDEYDEE